MDAVEFHREPPSNIPTMVVAFGGWIDAGEAVTGTITDPAWQARLEACGMRTRRSRYEGPTGIATIVMDAARQRGMTSCNVRGQAPHYLERTTNPAVTRALLTAVTRLLDLELDLS